MKTAYFDANVFFDVFELRNPALHQELEQLVQNGKVQIVISDLTLTEALEGNHRDEFPNGMRRLFEFDPKWLYITGLASREVEADYGAEMAGSLTPGAHLDWPDLLPLISEPDDLTDIPDLATPTPEALLEFYPPGTVTDRMKHWKGELKAMQTGLKTLMAGGKKNHDIFGETVAFILKRNPKNAKVKAFAEALIADPDRASALRLETELNCLVLNVSNPKWTKNDFFDHLHAGALSYVDLFLTRDEGLIEKIAWYDENVRKPRGATPYGPKICPTFADFTARL